MIKERIKIDVAAYRLILWRVRSSWSFVPTLWVTLLWPREVTPVKPSDTLSQRLRALGEFSQFTGKFDSVGGVSDVFQTQSPTFPHLDVLVQHQDKSTLIISTG